MVLFSNLLYFPSMQCIVTTLHTYQGGFVDLSSHNEKTVVFSTRRLHLIPVLLTVWGFTDAGNRYWALPIEWQSVAHRLLMVVRMVMRMRMMRMLKVINLNMVKMMKTVTITKIMTGTPRILLAYPAGYQYGQYHHHDYLYPKYGWCITN